MIAKAESTNPEADCATGNCIDAALTDQTTITDDSFETYAIYPALKSDFEAFTADKSNPNIVNQAEWTKYKKRKRAAIGCVIAGPILTVGGFICMVGGGIGSIFTDGDGGSKAMQIGGTVALFVGLGLDIASVPLFISAHKHKKQALGVGITQFSTPSFTNKGNQNAGISLAYRF